MMPIGPLMIEHRLIERMVRQVGRERDRIEATGRIDTAFILTASDFFQIYTDFCHHGKEEQILFTELEQRPLAPELASTMRELIEEHQTARELVKRLNRAAYTAVDNDPQIVGEVTEVFRSLGELYPRHIAKEDKHFFIPCMDYFTRHERDEMLNTFFEFDRRFIHQLYQEKVLRVEESQSA